MRITLRAARINAELTIKQVTKKIGVSEEVLRNYERSRTVVPDEILRALLELYGMDTMDLKSSIKN